MLKISMNKAAGDKTNIFLVIPNPMTQKHEIISNFRIIEGIKGHECSSNDDRNGDGHE